MAHHKNGLLEVPSHLKLATVENPKEPDTASFHFRTFKNLFPHAPLATDVTQGDIGDCYLMASLIGLASSNSGPELIERSMKDVGLGRVVVRFYDTALAPNYYVMKKSVSDVGATGPLWVKMIEKAYAYAFSQAAYKALGDIAGKQHGLAVNVMRAIAGGQAEMSAIKRNSETFVSLMGTTRGMKGHAERQAAIAKEVFGGNPDLLEAWKEFYTGEKAKAWWSRKPDKIFRDIDFEWFLKMHGEGMPAAVRDAVLFWIDAERILPGKRGTGRYTRQQMDKFTTIRTALINGQPVAGGTHKSVSRASKTQRVKGPAGEAISSTGLAGGHVYAIIDTELRDGLCMLKLRNPWGKIGVSYKRVERQGSVQMKPRQTAEGEFWLELNDLTKQFSSLHVGPQAAGLLAAQPRQ